MCVLSKHRQYKLHMRRCNTAVRSHVKHEKAEARGCRPETQRARRAGQTVGALPSLTWERRLAGRRALCGGGSRGRLLVTCHLLPYSHKHRDTQWETVRARLCKVRFVRKTQVNKVYTTVTQVTPSLFQGAAWSISTSKMSILPFSNFSLYQHLYCILHFVPFNKDSAGNLLGRRNSGQFHRFLQ